MAQNIYLKILAPRNCPCEFNLYLPSGNEFYTKYRFVYEVNDIDSSLTYDTGPNNPANRKFWRIRTAHIVKKTDVEFVPMFRALSDGEIGLALREEGAGDFSGGFHGDEVLSDAKLAVNGTELPLDKPFFGVIQSFEFFERSTVFRCNTPSTPLLLHTQNYTVSQSTLCAAQELEWLTDAHELANAFMPMLTAQRLNVDDPSEVLTDSVEFYDENGAIVTTFDTSDSTSDKIGSPSESVCQCTKAVSAKVYGKQSGFSAEAGYKIRDNSIPKGQTSTSLCIRHMRNAVDNKIYFDIGKGTAPKRGDIWKTDVYYRIMFNPLSK